MVLTERRQNDPFTGQNHTMSIETRESITTYITEVFHWNIENQKIQS